MVRVSTAVMDESSVYVPYLVERNQPKVDGDNDIVNDVNERDAVIPTMPLPATSNQIFPLVQHFSGL